MNDEVELLDDPKAKNDGNSVSVRDTKPISRRRTKSEVIVRDDLSKRFDQFIEDRSRLSDRKPLAAKTLRSYRQAHDAFKPAFIRTKVTGRLYDELWTVIHERLELGKMTDSGMNVYIRGLNAFLSWCYEFGYMEHLRIDLLPIERRKPFPRLAKEAVENWKKFAAETLPQLRAKHMALLILDAGIRAEECLALRLSDIEWSGSRIWIGTGKGGANRHVPLSDAGKCLLRRYIAQTNMYRSGDDSPLFCTKAGRRVSYRHSLRDVKQIGLRLGTPWVGWHTFRRTFATHYIRSGGLLTDLQQILGHTDLRTTIIYVGGDIEELVTLHDDHSALNRSTKRPRSRGNRRALRAVTTALACGFRQRR